jgi:hypothetical protein
MGTYIDLFIHMDGYIYLMSDAGHMSRYLDIGCAKIERLGPYVLKFVSLNNYTSLDATFLICGNEDIRISSLLYRIDPIEALLSECCRCL